MIELIDYGYNRATPVFNRYVGSYVSLTQIRIGQTLAETGSESRTDKNSKTQIRKRNRLGIAVRK